VAVSSSWRIVLVGAIAILLFDALASLAARTLKFPYVYATVGSWLIYAGVAFAVGQRASVPTAVVETMLVGFVEATLGWRISWLIGPGRTPSGTVTTSQVARALLLVLGTAAIIGAAAAWQARQH
jgi:hypothetical protein